MTIRAEAAVSHANLIGDFRPTNCESLRRKLDFFCQPFSRLMSRSSIWNLDSGLSE